jgi:hypothetical protein
MAKTSRIPALHASETRTSCAAGTLGLSRISARSAVTIALTGWWAPMACSQPGMELSGTKAQDVKTSRNMTGTPAEPAF